RTAKRGASTGASDAHAAERSTRPTRDRTTASASVGRTASWSVSHEHGESKPILLAFLGARVAAGLGRASHPLGPRDRRDARDDAPLTSAGGVHQLPIPAR